jgi:CheY-like chemotaxis protein
MVYGFVQQSGGQIEVDSEEGSGTTFRIYFPGVTGVSKPPQHREAEPPQPDGTETILCVEDNETVRSYVLLQLQRLGYKTLSASNGAEALAMVEQGRPFDLLFTDVIMPGRMNGRQLAHAVARLRPSLKVLFTTGFADDILSVRDQLDPEVLLLKKPYRVAELARMIRMALDRNDKDDAGEVRG